MNVAASPSIEGSVADLYLNRKTLRDMDEDDSRRAGARRTLGLGSFIKPFVMRGGNLLRMLWQALVALVRKVASVFKVNVDVPESPSAGGGQPSAEFSSPDGGPEGVAAVDSAAMESAKDLSALVAQLGSRQTDKERLIGPEGVAYAALNLQEFGSAVVDAREELSRADVVLHAAAVSAATSCGSSVESMKALLENCSFNQPGLESVLPADIQDLARRRAQLQSDLCSLRLKFSEFSIDGLAAAREAQMPQLESSIRAKVLQFADQEMADLIFSKGLAQDKEDGDVLKTKLSSQQIESKEIITDESAHPSVPAPGRRSWVGVSAGVVDDLPEDGPDASSHAPRQR